MAELRVLLADDEHMARARMSRLLAALGVEVVAACASGPQLLEALESERVDAVFLDLDMPEMRGDELADLVGDDGPMVVFATAHEDHAVQAFAQGAVDYLLKPISRARLEVAVDRLRARLAGPPEGAAERLALPTARGVRLLAFAEVLSCAIDGEGVAVRTQEGVLYTSLRLSELERRLPGGFRRVHRQALVNLDRVRELVEVRGGGTRARLDDGSEVSVSRAAARRLRRELLG